MEERKEKKEGMRSLMPETAAIVDELRLALGTEVADRIVRGGMQGKGTFRAVEKGADGLPPTDGLRFTCKDTRVIIRPSGTEPKLKCYLQVIVPVTGDIAQARATAQSELDAVRSSVAEALAL